MCPANVKTEVANFVIEEHLQKRSSGSCKAAMGEDQAKSTELEAWPRVFMTAVLYVAPLHSLLVPCIGGMHGTPAVGSLHSTSPPLN